MATFMINIAGEGQVSVAHKNSDAGPTTGSSIIYEVMNVPADVTGEQVVTLMKAKAKAVPANDVYEVAYADLL